MPKVIALERRIAALERAQPSGPMLSTSAGAAVSRPTWTKEQVEHIYREADALLAKAKAPAATGAAVCGTFWAVRNTFQGKANYLRDTEDGFRISEEDLAIRGAGDLIGTAQSGLPKFRVADLERQASLMAIAQTDARRLLGDDPALQSPRGLAVRSLLWLLDQERAMQLIRVG